MKCLLDSHALLWAVADSPRLSSRARDLILDAENDVPVSAASYYELIFKARRGRLGAAALGLPEDVAKSNFDELDISKAHLLAAAAFNWSHGDPWDRIIAAQAMIEDCVLVSADEIFDDIGLQRTW